MYVKLSLSPLYYDFIKGGLRNSRTTVLQCDAYVSVHPIFLKNRRKLSRSDGVELLAWI